MSRLPIPATIEDAPAASRSLLEAVKKQLGVVPNLFRLVANSSAALEGYLGLSGALAKGKLPAATRERIALAVAEINGCGYCLSAHTYLAKNLAKLDDAEIAANRNGASNDPKADAAIRFAAKVTTARGHVSDEDVRAVMPAMDELKIGWLEEPFPAHNHRSYKMAKGFGRTPLAAGENHYTRFEFHRVIEDGNITILQPDLSKSGGITEVQRIAAAASMWKLPIHPHSSMTGLNHAVSIHFLASIDNGGYFEADLSVANKFRDELGSTPWQIGKDGTVRPLDKPGIGVEIDEKFLIAHPVIEGPGYV